MMRVNTHACMYYEYYLHNSDIPYIHVSDITMTEYIVPLVRMGLPVAPVAPVDDGPSGNALTIMKIIWYIQPY